jgi:carboxymethylenebutenolidase
LELTMAEIVQFKTHDSTASGYLATPPQVTGPAVIVLQEWWGLNPQLKGVCDRLAGDGFIAFAPDLYHGELAGHDEMDKAAELMTSMPPDRAAVDMSGAVDLLLDHPAREGSGIGVLGFCMGGMLALLLAALRGDDIAVSVPFYGFPAGESEPDWSGLTAVVRGHMAEHDANFPPEAARALEAKLQNLGKDAQFAFYDAGHAFMNEENALGTYDGGLASSVWSQTLRVLREQLIPGAK